MKPATALPWIHRDIVDGVGAIDAADGTHVAQAFQVLPLPDDIKQVSRQRNAAYIVHAANAYPELVEELRAAHRECDRAGLAVQATMGDCAVAANLAFQRDAIAALLAKLGEQ